MNGAMANGHLPVFRLPKFRFNTDPGINQQRRLELLRRLVTDPQPPLVARMAACLLLLYAQPVTRIAVLHLDDVICHDDGQVLL